MSGAALTPKLGTDGVFERQFADLSDADDGAADRLRGQIAAFARAPEARGFFLRGAQDGRKRYLVPEGCGQGVMERAVAVVEVRPSARVAVLLRLYAPEAVDPSALVARETQQADLDFDI